MTIADPYVVRIPQFVFDTDDPELIGWFEYDNRWKHDIFQQLGGGTDLVAGSTEAVSANDNQIAYLNAQLNQLREKLEMLGRDVVLPTIVKRLRPVSATTAYTAVSGDFVNASSGITVTLPGSPVRDDQVIVRVSDGTTITVNGNGRNVNGKTTQMIKGQNNAIDFYYFIDDNAWFAR